MESTTLLHTRNRLPALLSFVAQAAIAAIVVAIPLLHPELLPTRAPALSLVPPPPRVQQPPPPPQHLRVAPASADTPSLPSAPAAQRSFLPTLLPTVLSAEEPSLAATLGQGMGNSNPSSLGIGDLRGHTPNVITVSSTPPTHTGAVKVSGGVIAGLLLSPIRPEYPAIAKAAHMEGTVVIRAVISSTGAIEKAQAVGGPVMLQSAALEAVERAHYKPYLLNGQPTEVDTTITVNFRLSS